MQDTEAWFFVADGRWILSEESRLLFTADVALTEASGSSFEVGRFADVSLGWAYRPVNNERWNVLALSLSI